MSKSLGEMELWEFPHHSTLNCNCLDGTWVFERGKGRIELDSLKKLGR